MDNAAPPGTTDTQTAPAATQQTQQPAQTQTTQSQQTTTFNWKSQLPADVANSPTMKKFADDPNGLAEAVKSHLSLERLLGHEKVPIPKGKDDAEGRAAFNRAMGIPDKPDGYQLPDVKIPESLKGMTLDKTKFAEIAHARNLTPEQATELWNDYTKSTVGVYENALREQQAKQTNTINQMRGEWGDAYQAKIELGQLVLNKFAPDKEANDYLTAVLVSDPNGIKFLAKLGEQFQENKIGDFKYPQYSMTPEDAQKTIDEIRQDPKHPYNNDKAPVAERDRAIDYVNSLIGVVNKGKQR